MKKIFFLLVLIFISFIPCNAIENNPQKSIETFRYSLPDDNCTIETKETLPNDVCFPSELELKGSVIYTESENQKEIELGSDIQKPVLKIRTSESMLPKNRKVMYNKSSYIPDRSAISSASRLIGEEYTIKPVWTMVREYYGNFSYGTEYSSFIDTSQFETSMNLYTRYDFKYFAVTGAVGTNEKNTEGINDRTFQIAPEIKLSKSFVIRDTIKAYVDGSVKKNKISLIYTPQWKKHPDVLWLEIGLTNSYYNNGKVNSSIEFLTKIKL